MLLLDTNAVSELRKVRQGKAHPAFAAWARAQEVQDLYLSVITLQELETGVLLAELRDPPKGAIFRAWLQNQVLPAFAARLLPVDAPVARAAARLHVPNPRPVRDALIAATALVHNMPVVTRDSSDFLPMGVQLINPWQ